jgi:hypothetical protein
MQFRKVIQRRIRKAAGGVDLASDVNAAVAANVGERAQTTTVSSHSSARSGRATSNEEVDRDREEGQDGRAD